LLAATDTFRLPSVAGTSINFFVHNDTNPDLNRVTLFTGQVVDNASLTTYVSLPKVKGSGSALMTSALPVSNAVPPVIPSDSGFTWTTISSSGTSVISRNNLPLTPPVAPIPPHAANPAPVLSNPVTVASTGNVAVSNTSHVSPAPTVTGQGTVSSAGTQTAAAQVSSIHNTPATITVGANTGRVTNPVATIPASRLPVSNVPARQTPPPVAINAIVPVRPNASVPPVVTSFTRSGALPYSPTELWQRWILEWQRLYGR